jgi:hypothetical protein
VASRFMLDVQKFAAPVTEFIPMALADGITQQSATDVAYAMVLNGEVRLAKVIDTSSKTCVAEFEWRLHRYPR